MIKIIGMIRNQCGKITSIVWMDPATGDRIVEAAGNRAEELYGRYPQYTENMHVVGNQGLVFLEKNEQNLKLVTCAGIFVQNGIESEIIDKVKRLDMRMVNAEVRTNSDGKEFLYIL